ncbi:alpha/beta fold hydrolase [Methylobacterium sp. Leaf118]|uniref:alpha/beta fold hydrolase n=1 Tax=Methylobacterium sp. Leaf118 TaxID=2876562 RepID=UPI001E557409|nr:alpha/beta hydrolase [Methylobacterium sp. Leaf118]
MVGQDAHAPPLVLLHGWPQTWFAWRDTMAALSDRFRVIAPDLRGLDLTERPAGGSDKRTIAADIQALIAHAAGGRATIVGHDTGGKAALVLAHLHPDTFERLVLVDCLVPGTENGDALNGGAWHYGFPRAPDIPEMPTAGRERDFLRAQIRAWSFGREAVSEDANTEYARHYATPGGMAAGVATYRALREDAALVASFPRTLAMPVLAIAGRHGVGERLAEGLAGRTERLSRVVVDECGHFVAEEAPEVFRRELARFLGV